MVGTFLSKTRRRLATVVHSLRLDGLVRMSLDMLDRPTTATEVDFSGIRPAMRTAENVVAEIATTNLPMLLTAVTSCSFRRTSWNHRRAVQELQISYDSLLFRLRQIGLEDTRSKLIVKECLCLKS